MSITISAQDVKSLRERTGAGIMDSKAALQEAEGDLDKAIEILRVKGQASAAKRGERAAAEGVVSSYIHSGGKIGVMVEVDCETDFVARTEPFQDFAREVAMHVAAANPLYVSEDEVDEQAKEAELRVLREQAAAEAEGKPENVQEKIVEGRLKKWLEDVVLLDQKHVNEEKHGGKTVGELRTEIAASTERERRDPSLRPLPGRGGVTEPVFRRILLKLSGEALMGDLPYGADAHRIAAIAKQVKAVSDRGVEIAIVVGGGNIYRGLKGAADGMDRATGDYMGMLATVLNALALQDALEKVGAVTRVQSAITISEVAEPYIRRRAMRHLEKGRIVIFAAGTGNPFFTTDTAAALRALEIHAETILMAKNGVEGVYSADPREDPDARFIEEITHQEAIEQRLQVMDSTALSLCMDNGLPINVFNMDDERNIDRIVCGERVGTVVRSG